MKSKSQAKKTLNKDKKVSNKKPDSIKRKPAIKVTKKAKAIKKKKNVPGKGLQASNVYIKYISKVLPEMMKKFKYKSPMAVPRLEKIVVNTGIGPWVDKKEEVRAEIKKDLGMICGQRPAPTRARKAIAGFNIREGQEVGMKVVLRGIRMYDFLERLITEALPRIRDFRGIPEKSFGEKGELSFGIKEHISFAEINSEDTENIFSLEVSIVSTSTNKQEGVELLKLLGFPIRSDEEAGVMEKIEPDAKDSKKDKTGKAKKS
ncbi:MAG: 50S ribosomal protein L5 [Patescibacteria group bacterium]|nr:50S ribosomal protein L5 [Patescibacteria group bacterium]